VGEKKVSKVGVHTLVVSIELVEEGKIRYQAQLKHGFKGSREDALNGSSEQQTLVGNPPEGPILSVQHQTQQEAQNTYLVAAGRSRAAPNCDASKRR
jgi:hypothetical protein